MTSNDHGFKAAQVKEPAKSEGRRGRGGATEAYDEIADSRKQFIHLGLNDVKQMVAGAKPNEVANVASGWRRVRVSLVGEDWHSGIKKQFDDSVNKVLESWHGPSAEAFAKAAQKISESFAKLAPYPHDMHNVMEQIGERLREVQDLVDNVQEPSEMERIADRAADFGSSGAGKGAVIGNAVPGVGALVGGLVGGMVGGSGRDDSQLNAALADPKITIGEAVNKNRGSLSIDRERQLEAAHYMEQLATTYRVGAKAIGPAPTANQRRQGEIPERDPSDSNIPPIGPYGPMPSAPKSPGGAANVPGMKGGGYKSPQPLEAPRPHGIDGGIGGLPKTPAPNVGTTLDGLSGGGLGAGGGAGAGGIGGGAGGGVGTGGLGTGAGVGGGSGSGIGGGAMPGMVGGAGAGARGGGAGTGAGARGGRAGMPGMAGGAGGGAKGAGAKGAGAKGGGLARQKGGLVGGKGGAVGAGGQGGSGLHRSRGGTQQGAAGGRRPMGMAGGHGAHGAKGKDKGGEDGQRPDYLVEDEETWTPERNVAPKVIE
ncbi:hypothetical protein QT196_29115 [Streptomyces sp. P9-2B-2]|uniref:hypothetical protein n=1 Tax=Streptomyces sp. P9-2B-2 TaxID=3057114 RepID=UPI0025B5FA3F|nr:hypothetical protein [Streptomyces sp. P9-2B-2]WJY41009.1 hypothetical protein QT196_29115 [Streptomyces sp. P9-2B-2]